MIIAGLLLLSAYSCNGPAKQTGGKSLSTLEMQKQVQDAMNFQQSLNREFRNPETTPLTEEGLENFEGLEFFPLNQELMFKMKIRRTPQAKPFMMQRTKDEVKYVKYGEVTFNYGEKTHRLSLYQNSDLIDRNPDYENHLFLPFTDLTNGEETYGGGRYLDLEIPDGEEIIIDFNMAYNPYCAYNKKYSCPIPPKENHLDMRVEAGVKMTK